MIHSQYFVLARLAPALALLACAAPKARVVETPKPSSDPAVAVVPAGSEPGVVASPDGGIRLPDMLALPGDADFRATTPTAPKGRGDSGAVISRPPTDPPSRPKPKPAVSE